jgi:hypothetical protein
MNGFFTTTATVCSSVLCFFIVNAGCSIVFDEPEEENTVPVIELKPIAETRMYQFPAGTAVKPYLPFLSLTSFLKAVESLARNREILADSIGLLFSSFTDPLITPVCAWAKPEKARQQIIVKIFMSFSLVGTIVL